jgi:glycogen operon protein
MLNSVDNSDTSVPADSDRSESFQLTFQQLGESTVIAIQGRLAGTLSVEDRDRVIGLSRSSQTLTLDFNDLTGFSGAGLRKLLQFCRLVQSQGGTLSVTGLSQELSAYVEAAGFTELFSSKPPQILSPAHPNITPRIDVYPTHHQCGYAIRPGSPLPFGATLVAGGVNFAVFSHHAHSCALVLFESGCHEPVAEIQFPPEFRVGDVFAMMVFDLDPEEFEYGLRLDGPSDLTRRHRFDDSQILLDPTARCIVIREATDAKLDGPLSQIYRARLIPDDFDWNNDQPLNLPFEDLVIYEAHVRGFTKSESSGVTFPGTFAGIREKIPYLKDLGINCLELLPIFQFNELDNDRVNPTTSERIRNYWGYNTVGFYAPHAGFAATNSMGTQVDELKALVKELHRNGIEIMLDVVFNHTAEGNENGPTISFRGLDNSTYYMLSPHGEYLNFSGCGNTFNCNHPVVRDFVLNCLRYWVAEYHIDGFRFDLASIMGRSTEGDPLPNPPLLESLAMDPVLAKTKLIAEAWDAGGLYQVGSFPAYGRWAEWNGKFRDCVRKSLKSDLGQIPELAKRLIGSPDVYPVRGPTASVNFVTCHDGFTLADLVSYNDKHNTANGENNSDGTNENYSWNCGIEGPTDDVQVLNLRHRQIKNALAMLFLSQGVPMLLMGDEAGRSQQGNNNAYCQDNPVSWLDWNLLEVNKELYRFCRYLIGFRHQHEVLRCRVYAGQASATGDIFEVDWHGTKVSQPDWSEYSRVLALTMKLSVDGKIDVIYAALNLYWEPLMYELPKAPTGHQWHQFMHTGMAAPDDICEPGKELPLSDQSSLQMTGRSIAILVARPM